MSRYRVTTQAGSIYDVDTDAKTLSRTPGEGAGELHADGGIINYQWIEFEPGAGLHALHEIDGELKMRVTTKVMKVEEL